MFQLSSSLSAGSDLNLAETLAATRALKHIHLDIDDGNFVHEITFGADTARTVCTSTNVPVDVHLEVLNPLDYVEPLARAGVAAVCAHVEALAFPSEFLSAARKAGIPKVGLACNLKTPIDELLSYANQVDYFLFVSVEADSDGLPFRPMTLWKVRRVYEALRSEELQKYAGACENIELWVDGGVNEQNLPDVVAAGADGVVVGRAVFGAEDPIAAAERICALGESCRIANTKEA